MKKQEKKTRPRLILRTYSIHSRPSKVDIKSFAKPFQPDSSFETFLQSFPDILAAKDFKDFLALLKKAKAKRKAILWGLGAHVIKVGLNPILIDLMERRWVSGLALNGAGIVHDFEIAYCGQTSEDVELQIRHGRFGMARETGEYLNRAIKRGADEGLGLGEAVGRMVACSDFPHKDMSLLAASHRLGIPLTVHVAIGTDTIHFHPGASGEALGKTTLADFFLFCSLVKKLEGGGAYLNCGSAVILPEIFLKATTYARNQGTKLENFSTAVFDFIRHYRPSQNVALRPLGKRGRGFYFIGHHEILLPLLAAGLKIGR